MFNKRTNKKKKLFLIRWFRFIHMSDENWFIIFMFITVQRSDWCTCIFDLIFFCILLQSFKIIIFKLLIKESEILLHIVELYLSSGLKKMSMFLKPEEKILKPPITMWFVIVTFICYLSKDSFFYFRVILLNFRCFQAKKVLTE